MVEVYVEQDMQTSEEQKCSNHLSPFSVHLVVPVCFSSCSLQSSSISWQLLFLGSWQKRWCTNTTKCYGGVVRWVSGSNRIGNWNGDTVVERTEEVGLVTINYKYPSLQSQANLFFFLLLWSVIFKPAHRLSLFWFCNHVLFLSHTHMQTRFIT